MSVEEVKRFFLACKDDKALQKELANIGTDNDACVAVAKRHGYDFTADELSSLIDAKKSELTEEELEKVSAAGGDPGLLAAALMAI